MRRLMNAFLLSLCSFSLGSSLLLAQAPDAGQPQDKAEQADRPGRGPGPFGGPGGPLGMGLGPRMMLSRMPLMAALDADGDGEISASEIDGAVAALKKLDKNSDGKLTTEELLPEGMRGPFGPGGPNFPELEEVINRMMMADTNGDGFIDQDEMPERMKTMLLPRVDANKDGKISKEELTKMAAQMGRGGAEPRSDRAERRSDRDGAEEAKRPRRPASE
ncbi:MAG: EF-hand domain-containing protein [Aureliella sp.]